MLAKLHSAVIKKRCGDDDFICEDDADTYFNGNDEHRIWALGVLKFVQTAVATCEIEGLEDKNTKVYSV